MDEPEARAHKTNVGNPTGWREAQAFLRQPGLGSSVVVRASHGAGSFW